MNQTQMNQPSDPRTPLSHLDWIREFICNDEDAYDLVRDMLIRMNDDDFNVRIYNSSIMAALAVTHLQEMPRDDLTTLCLELSLCPLHQVDYAICFDDDDPACSQIRIIHPSHDT